MLSQERLGCTMITMQRCALFESERRILYWGKEVLH